MDFHKIKENAVKNSNTLAIDDRNDSETFTIGDPDITQDRLADILSEFQRVHIADLAKSSLWLS